MPAERPRATASEEANAPGLRPDDADPILPTRLVTGAELIDASCPPLQYVIEPYFARRWFSLVAADGGLFKSTLLFHAVLSVATARPWLGVLGVEQGKAIFVSTEDDLATLQQRCRAYLADIADAEERARAEQDIRANVSVLSREAAGEFVLTRMVRGRVEPATVERIDRAPVRTVDVLADLCADAKLIVLETISDLHGGPEDNVGFRTLAKQFERLAQRTAASIVAIHHVSRTDARAKATDGSRGGTALPNKSRSRISLNMRRDGAIVLTHQKCTYGVPRPPLVVRTLETEHGPVFRATSSDPLLESDAQALLDHLRSTADGLTKRQIHNTPPCGLTARRAKDAIDHLVATSRVELNTEARGATNQTAYVYRAAADAPELQ